MDYPQQIRKASLERIKPIPSNSENKAQKYILRENKKFQHTAR
jgi:hypothetical protein